MPAHQLIDLALLSNLLEPECEPLVQVGAPEGLQLATEINNLFNRQYYTVAQLGPAGFTAAGTLNARPFPSVGGDFPVQQTTFFTPGAPRAFTLSARVTF